MYGAILGDIIGSPYEFDMGNKSKEFPLLSENSTFTDDTVMTMAVSEVFLDNNLPTDEESTIEYFIFEDNEQHRAAWLRDSFICYISGPLSVEELKMMIDSIEEGQ